MQTSLAYIDEALDRAIDAEDVKPNIPKPDREAAERKGRKLIGGFRVHDGEAEKKALDDIIAKRRGQIEQFRKDRTAIRNKLSGLGIVPLTVCPVTAWLAICKDAGLFVLSPDAQARVGYNREGFKDLAGASDGKIDKQLKADWPGTLKRMFPDGRCIPSGPKATLILPDPPADVAAVLCKAQSLSLKVAAVAGAIGFAEKPSELAKATNTNPKDLWAQQQGYADYADWVRRDPIIFTEHESAVAVVAQFGEFPIEKRVVDTVVASGNLIAEKPAPVADMAAMQRDLHDLYAAMQRQAQQLIQRVSDHTGSRPLAAFRQGRWRWE